MLAGRMMYDWEKMASVVARKLVQNGQTRILQRIYEGITSNWDLDVADEKSSMDHLLIHLVWRKFPRNRRPPMDGQKTKISHSTQTEEVLELGLKKTSKTSIISDTDCLSASDMMGLFDANESDFISDADWDSDCSLSSMDLVAQKGASSKFSAKGRDRNRSKKGKSHRKKTSSKVKSPPELSYETQLRQFKDSIKTSNNSLPENVPNDIPTTSYSGILGVGDSPPPVPPVTVVAKPEIIMDRATFDRMNEEDRDNMLRNGQLELQKNMDELRKFMGNLCPGLTPEGLFAAADYTP